MTTYINSGFPEPLFGRQSIAINNSIPSQLPHQKEKYQLSFELFQRILRENGSSILRNFTSSLNDEGISLWELIPITITYGLTFILGVIGNLMVLLTILLGLMYSF